MNTQTQIILQAIKSSQGVVDTFITPTINTALCKGFWSAIEFYSNKIEISSISTMNASEMLKVLQSGKNLVTENAFITYKFGGAMINGKNINPSQLAKFAGKVAVVK